MCNSTKSNRYYYCSRCFVSRRSVLQCRNDSQAQVQQLSIHPERRHNFQQPVLPDPVPQPSVHQSPIAVVPDEEKKSIHASMVTADAFPEQRAFAKFMEVATPCLLDPGAQASIVDIHTANEIKRNSQSAEFLPCAEGRADDRT